MRSAVYGRSGGVASSQPLATLAGVDVLNQGGSAADAAIAVAAALCVTEPCSTGVGGDFFALSYSATDRSVKAILGSGNAPRRQTLKATLEHAKDGCLAPTSPHTITVPGAVAGWCALLDEFGSGKVQLSEILAPAIKLAAQGFPVAPITAAQWRRSEEFLRNSLNGDTFLVNGCAPCEGVIFENPDLARTLEEIATHGMSGFYSGPVADSIISLVQSLGGVMDSNDLASCKAEVAEAIRSTYRDRVVYQIPPPTHGATVLLALNILDDLDIKSIGSHSSAAHLHVIADALRIAYSDAAAFIADPRFARDRTAEMLEKEYAKRRARELMSHTKCVANPLPGLEPGGTVQFCVIDKNGHAVSAVQSNYIGFGTGHVPKGCGFPLHNRGLNFSLEPGHPNALAGGKRPYHTIIPGLMTDARTGKLTAVFGCMGAFMQPQGHVQIVSNIVDWEMNAQQALDAPRLRIRGKFGRSEGEDQEEIALESGAESAAPGLVQRCHSVVDGTDIFFGRGQVITRDIRTGVLCGGSDGRADGMAICLV